MSCALATSLARLICLLLLITSNQFALLVWLFTYLSLCKLPYHTRNYVWYSDLALWWHTWVFWMRTFSNQFVEFFFVVQTMKSGLDMLYRMKMCTPTSILRFPLKGIIPLCIPPQMESWRKVHLIADWLQSHVIEF